MIRRLLVGVSGLLRGLWPFVLKSTHQRQLDLYRADTKIIAQWQERMRTFETDPELKKRRVERMTEALRASPAFKAQKSAQMKALNKTRWSDPRLRALKSEEMRKRNADPEFRARQSARMKERWADPEFKARMSAARWGRGETA